jgi:hypothetical protein
MTERFRRGLSIATACAALLLAGCQTQLFDAFGFEDDFEHIQQRYTRLVRWNEFNKASEFVDPALRVDYLRDAHELKGLRFTDYEVSWIEESQDRLTAKAHVVYRAYWTAALIELPELEETQEWYRDPETKNWLVRPDIASIRAEFLRASQ